MPQDSPCLPTPALHLSSFLSRLGLLQVQPAKACGPFSALRPPWPHSLGGLAPWTHPLLYTPLHLASAPTMPAHCEVAPRTFTQDKKPALGYTHLDPVWVLQS